MIKLILGFIGAVLWFGLTVAPVLICAVIYDAFEFKGWRIRRIKGGRLNNKLWKKIKK